MGQTALQKSCLQGMVVAVKAVGHDGPKRDARSLRALDQFERDLRLGTKRRVLPALGQALFWRVGRYM